MDQEKDPKAAVNPAARHDPPEPRVPAVRRGDGEEEQPQVSAAQEEPLNPLDPGGIGA